MEIVLDLSHNPPLADRLRQCAQAIERTPAQILESALTAYFDDGGAESDALKRDRCVTDMARGLAHAMTIKPTGPTSPITLESTVMMATTPSCDAAGAADGQGE